MEDFLYPERIIQLGFEPVRIDILTSISGVTFDNVRAKKKKGLFGNEKTYFIGKKELIKTKKISNRIQDKLDVEILKLKK